MSILSIGMDIDHFIQDGQTNFFWLDLFWQLKNFEHPIVLLLIKQPKIIGHQIKQISIITPKIWSLPENVLGTANFFFIIQFPPSLQ
jgi:hypothetical protein